MPKGRKQPQNPWDPVPPPSLHDDTDGASVSQNDDVVSESSPPKPMPLLTHHESKEADGTLAMLAGMMDYWRREAEERREADEQQRQEEYQRRREEFAQLVAALASPQPVNPVQPSNTPPQNPSDASTTPGQSVPPPKAAVKPPSPLAHDVTLRAFKEWRQRQSDCATMVDLNNLSQQKQLIQLRSCVSPDMKKKLEITMGVPNDSPLPIANVLQKIHNYVKEQRNEALRRLAFSQCRQEKGEKFIDFYVRLLETAEEVDLCKAHDDGCIETWMKHAILLGIRDEETKT